MPDAGYDLDGGDFHSFSVSAAVTVGVNAAILLGRIRFWCQKNKANDRHFHDGMWWTYNSVTAWSRLFPYMSDSQVRRSLKKLEDEGYIAVGNFNSSAFDRTLWYAITAKGVNLLAGRPESCVSQSKPKRQKEPDGQVSLFPIDEYEEPSSRDKDIDALIEYYNEMAHKNYRKDNAKLRGHINARLGDGFTPDEIRTAIRKKCADALGTRWEYMLAPDKLFAPSYFEDCLNMPENKVGVTRNAKYDAV